MSYCQYCGYELEAGAVFCWGCGKNDPLPGSAKRAKGANGNKGGSSSTLILIIVGALVTVAIAFFGVTALLSTFSDTTETDIIQEPTPTPSEDTGGIKKQNGNAAITPGQTLSTPANQR